MEGNTNYLSTLDVNKFCSDHDYLWSCLRNICQHGTYKDFSNILSILHKVKQISINVLFQVVNKERNGETLMQLSARHGNLNLIRYLLRNGISVNQDNSSGWTALHEACQYNQAQIVRFLLDSGAKSDGCDVRYKTPLQCLAGEGKGLKQFFLQSRETSLPSLLHTACRFGDIDTVRRLLSESVDLADAPYFLETPLSCASRNGQLEVVKYLVTEGKCAVSGSIAESSSTDSAVHLACAAGHLEVVKFLHSNGASISRRGKIVVEIIRRVRFESGGKTPLHYACENNYLTIVKYLLSNSVDTSPQDLAGDTALHIACRNGNVDIVQKLADAGAVLNLINDKGDTAFDVAENIKILTILKRSGAPISQLEGSSQLHRNAGEPRLFPKLKWILEETTGDVNQVNSDHATPLHLASYRGNVPAIEFLIRRAADVNAKDKNNATPLHYACACTSQPTAVETITHQLIHNQETLSRTITSDRETLSRVDQAVQILLEKGADLNAEDRKMETPLCRASLVGNSSVVELLIRRGARINMPQIDEVTKELRQQTAAPLHNACINGFPEIVKLLLQKGAEFNIPGGTHGYLPIIYALNLARDDHSEPHLKILKLLTEVGAFIDTTQTDQLCAFLATCRSKVQANIHAKTIVRMVLPTGLSSGENMEDSQFVPRMVKYLLQWNVLLPSTCTGKSSSGHIEDMFQRHMKSAPLLSTKLLIAADFFTPFIAKALSFMAEPDADTEWQILRDKVLHDTTQTKSLFHACRTFVRRTLGRQFETKVFLLPLPMRLKSCLLLPELDEII